MTDLDLAVTFPSRGVIRLRSRTLFGYADSPLIRRFLKRVFQAGEISNVTITGGLRPRRNCASARRPRVCKTWYSGSSAS